MFEDNGGMLEKEPFSLTRANYTKVGFNLLSVSPVTSLEGRGQEDCKCCFLQEFVTKLIYFADDLFSWKFVEQYYYALAVTLDQSKDISGKISH